MNAIQAQNSIAARWNAAVENRDCGAITHAEFSMITGALNDERAQLFAV